MTFAESYPDPTAIVLDLECGQGRDANVFASQGMTFTGVDTSPTGIDQMMAFAEANGLKITGAVKKPKVRVLYQEMG